MLAMGPKDLNPAPYSPVHCSSHSMTSFQSSELTELPVVENSQLFAQRAHSTGYAPLVCRSHLQGTHISDKRAAVLRLQATKASGPWLSWKGTLSANETVPHPPRDVPRA